MTMATCRSCGASIIWAKRADGKAMPLEAVDPNTGNIKIDTNGFITVGKAGSGHYQAHFVTCPQAGQWRSGQRPKKPSEEEGED